MALILLKFVRLLPSTTAVALPIYVVIYKFELSCAVAWKSLARLMLISVITKSCPVLYAIIGSTASSN